MKIYASDIHRAPEEIKKTLEDQYELTSTSFNPSTVNTYVAVRCINPEGSTLLTAYRTHCIFSKEQAVRVAASMFSSWIPTIEECFTTNTQWFEKYLLIEFDNKPAITHKIYE